MASQVSFVVLTFC